VAPSITAVVYGAGGNSPSGPFMAGFLPGFMIGIGLVSYRFLGAVGIPQPRAAFGQFTDATK
jgi:TRAP-type C4-dicarboxylate transport system permease large subunit